LCLMTTKRHVIFKMNAPMNVPINNVQMVTPEAQAGMQAQAVYGMRIANPRLATLTRRVLTLSAVIALLNIIIRIVAYFLSRNQISGLNIIAALVSAGLSLLVPACGYFGAKNSDRNLACCFCGCNLLGSACNIFSIIFLAIAQNLLKLWVDQCNPSEENRVECPDWGNVCGYNYDAQECYDELASSFSSSTVIVVALISLPVILLQCLAFVWGSQLYSELKSGQVIHQVPMQYATNAVFVQPQGPQVVQPIQLV